MQKKIKILLVRLTAIGDVIHSLPVLYALRQKYPDAYITWLVEDKAAELLINNPLLDKVYILPKKKWKKQGLTINTCKEIFQLVKAIRQDKYDIAIDLQELFKSGILTFLSGAKRRIGHAGTREFAHIFVNEKLKGHDFLDPERFVVERYLEAAEYLGAPINDIKFSLPPISQETKAYIDRLLAGIDKKRPVVVFAPATTWVTKHWPEEYWSQLLDEISKNNNVIFVGSTQDIALISRITSKAKTDNYISLAGKTGLLELVELFYRTDIIIAPDTGPAFIANAAERPVIIQISGSTSNKRTRPHGDKHTAITTGIPCQPCHKKQCCREDNQIECMKKITPDIILSIFNNKLTLIGRNIVL